MTDIEALPPSFEIQLNIKGKEQTILVKPDETSDGARYYNCILDGETLTQIREETDGNWEQLWGTLDQQDVDAIGGKIRK